MYSSSQSGYVLSNRTDEVVARGLYGALPLSYSAPIQSGAGGIRTHTTGVQGMYSDPAVGLYSIGDEVLVRGALPLSYAPVNCGTQSGDDWNRTNNRCTPTRQSPVRFSEIRPNEVFAETIVMGDVVPAGSWACVMTIQRGKRFRRGHLNRM